MKNGGYEEGYRACSCFWGVKPAGDLEYIKKCFHDNEKLTAVDLGCGEGKNAHYIASLGIQVLAIDISRQAIKNGVSTWPENLNLKWEVSDIRSFKSKNTYDIVVSTGSLHCLDNEEEIQYVIERCQSATKPNGINIISVFNDRIQDLQGHPSHFSPCCLPHNFYILAYNHWDILKATDDDLLDVHPNNFIPHKHSITRLVARRPG